MAIVDDGFYTMKGYNLLSKGGITSAMEDYLEMIARRQREQEAVRAVDLSAQLHVRASSVTKMIQQLAREGLVSAQKYGNIRLTDKGEQLGQYLLYRHNVLNRFLCFVNGTDDELEQVEKIEHFICERTVKNMERILQKHSTLPQAENKNFRNK